MIFFNSTKAWAKAIKRDVMVLWLAARDQRVPWHAKAVAGAVAAYALSPIDLIPDFIPVIGYLDDLIIVPLGIMLAVKLIPEDVLLDLREAAIKHTKPVSKAGLVFVVMLWLVAAFIAFWFFWPKKMI